jgi:S1-C subfamily serine protease
VILAMDGKSVDNAQELNYLLGTSHVGDAKLLEYKRGTETKQVSVTLIAAPETVQREETSISGQTPLSGVVVANLSPAVADEVGIDSASHGVVITQVKEGPAQQFLAKGDIIREVNGVAVDTVEALRRVLQRPARGWLIGFERRGQKVYLRLG